MLQAIRYVVATPLVLWTFGLDMLAETLHEVSGFLARVSNRIEGKGL